MFIIRLGFPCQRGCDTVNISFIFSCHVLLLCCWDTMEKRGLCIVLYKYCPCSAATPTTSIVLWKHYHSHGWINERFFYLIIRYLYIYLSIARRVLTSLIEQQRFSSYFCFIPFSFTYFFSTPSFHIILGLPLILFLILPTSLSYSLFFSNNLFFPPTSISHCFYSYISPPHTFIMYSPSTSPPLSTSLS